MFLRLSTNQRFALVPNSRRAKERFLSLMFQGLPENRLVGAVEALLFVTDEPVSILALAEILECDAKDIEHALTSLRESLESRGAGIQLREVAGGWRLFTHPAYHELIESYVLSWDTRKLSAAAMETLAIIAYTQPTTRASVASVRGVNSDSSINSLVEKGLVREVGTAESPGNPTLYGTTRTFLEKFGLKSAKDLPDLGDFAPDEETKRLIGERLSATRTGIEISADQAHSLAQSLMDGDAFAGDGEALLFDEELVDGINAAVATLNDVLESSQDSMADGQKPHAGESESTDNRNTEDISSREMKTEAAFAKAIATSLGVVEKIDFDSLTFETDDE